MSLTERIQRLEAFYSDPGVCRPSGNRELEVLRQMKEEPYYIVGSTNMAMAGLMHQTIVDSHSTPQAATEALHMLRPERLPAARFRYEIIHDGKTVGWA